jgi:hypothetical protein
VLLVAGLPAPASVGGLAVVAGDVAVEAGWVPAGVVATGVGVAPGVGVSVVAGVTAGVVASAATVGAAAPGSGIGSSDSSSFLHAPTATAKAANVTTPTPAN